MAETKLSTDQRMIVLRMYGEGCNYPEIARYCKEQFGIKIQPNAIRDTCNAKKWQPYVKDFRDRYMAAVKSVPIANKRIRIDDLERERLRLIDLIKKNPRKTKSDITQHLSLVAELRRLTDCAREEMEKKSHLFQNVVVGSIGERDDEYLHNRKEEILARARATLGRGLAGTDSDSGGIESESTE